MVKACTVCLEIKDISEFHCNRGSPDGMKTKCKECCKTRDNGYKSKPTREAVIAWVEAKYGYHLK